MAISSLAGTFSTTLFPMIKETKLGEALKSIRLSKHFSLQEVSFQTRIPERFINALENNLRNELPSNVHAKGYLRNLLAFYQEEAKPYLHAWNTDQILRIEDGSIEQEETSASPSVLNQKTIAPPPVDQQPNIDVENDALSAAEILNGIGKQLTIRRIQLGLELSEVEDFTHIKDHNLSFLEKGAFDQIPSPVQARGMLKIYAQFLELDQNELLRQYAEGLRKKRLEQIAFENRPAKKKSAVNFKKNNFLSAVLTPDFMVVGAVVLVLFIGIIWGSSYVINLKQEAAWEKLGVDRDIVAQDNLTATFTSSPTPVPVTETIPQENGETQTDGEETPVNNAPVQINLSARQRAWVRITADNQIVFEGRLVPGNPYNYSANQTLVLLTGNAAAVQVLFNNQYIGSLGDNGELVEMVFTDAGMITPTPLYSPTPTATLQPSITPTITPTIATATVTPFIP